jgi:hypothetical protein
MKTINFDRAKLEQLKQGYANARKHGAESFYLGDDEIVTDYAKYLIEYLEGQFGDKHDEHSN